MAAFFTWIYSQFGKPRTSFLAILLGLTCGYVWPDAASHLSPIQLVFSSLFKLCAIPIMISSIALALSQLLSSLDRLYIIRVLGVAGTLMIASAVVGAGLSRVVITGKDLGAIPTTTQEQLIDETPFPHQHQDGSSPMKINPIRASDVVGAVVPSNIFEALAGNKFFQILFFTVILGIVMGFSPPDMRIRAENGLQTLFDLTFSLIRFLLKFLPFFLFSLLYTFAAHMDPKIAQGLGHFLLAMNGVFITVIVLALLGIAIRLRMGPHRVVGIFQEPLLLAICSSSAFAALPSTLEALEKKMHLQREIVYMMTPMGGIVFRYGDILFFAFAATFFASVYQVSLSAHDWVILCLASITAGVGASSAAGPFAVSLLALVLDTLQIPSSAAVFLLFNIEPLVNPLRVGALVALNGLGVSLAVRRPEKDPHQNHPPFNPPQTATKESLATDGFSG